MNIEEQITRVCLRCSNDCQPRVGQFVYSKEKRPDGEVLVHRMDDVVVSDCCGATYEIYIGEQEVGAGSEGIDELTPIEEFD